MGIFVSQFGGEDHKGGSWERSLVVPSCKVMITGVRAVKSRATVLLTPSSLYRSVGSRPSGLFGMNCLVHHVEDIILFHGAIKELGPGATSVDGNIDTGVALR